MNASDIDAIRTADGIETRLAFDHLTLALKGIKPLRWLLPVMALATTITFSSWIAWPRLLTWLAVLSICLAPYAILTHRYLNRDVSSSRSVQSWYRRFCLVYAVHAMAWASLTYFLWLPGNDLNHCMIEMLLGCSLGSVANFYGSCRPLMLMGILIYGGALVVAPLFGDSRAMHSLLLIALPYVGLLAYIANQVHAETRNILLLRYENEGLLASQRHLIESKNVLIGELAAAKQVAEAACAQAESANQAKSQFLANMSHELRTPLNAILGFSEIIESRILGDSVEQNVEYASLIHSSGQHLLSLINDILDLAKIEAGSFDLVEKPVDLNSLVADALRLMEHRAQAGECTLIDAVDPDLPRLHADHRALKQIVINLLSNAIKFTPPGGSVTAFARHLTDGRIALSVDDTGVGIAPEDHSKVFEKFGQGRHDFKPKEKGTGLGLPVVRALVEMHGGEISLESEVGKGTTLTVTLPATRVIPADVITVT